MLITKHYGWTTRQNALTVAHTTTNKPYWAIPQERTLMKEDTLKRILKDTNTRKILLNNKKIGEVSSAKTVLKTVHRTKINVLR